MTVYVDDMRKPARVGRLAARWSHMFADTTDELVAFATSLGLREQWIQKADTHREHFDLTDRVRSRALSLGAVPITYPNDVMGLLQARRAGEPFDLEQWRGQAPAPSPSDPRPGRDKENR